MNAELTQGVKYPKLLLKDDYYTRLVIKDHHHRILHSAVTQTLAQVWHEYWIPCGCAMVKKVLKNCRICRQLEGKPFHMPKMPPLLTEWVARSLPFEYSRMAPVNTRHLACCIARTAAIKMSYNQVLILLWHKGKLKSMSKSGVWWYIWKSAICSYHFSVALS